MKNELLFGIRSVVVVSTLGLGLCVSGAAEAAVPSPSPRQPVRVWKGRDGLQPWAAKSHHHANKRFEGDDLLMDIVGWDPQTTIVFDPIDVTPDMAVRFTARTSLSGEGDVYFGVEGENDVTAQNGVNYAVIGDGQWHTYTVRLDWRDVKRITRLRIDFAGRRGAMDGETSGTCALRDVALVRAGLAPFAAKEADGVVFRMKADKVRYLSMLWSLKLGWTKTVVPKDLRFMTMPDGTEHTYYFNLSNALGRIIVGDPSWRGEVHGFSFANRLRNEEFMPEGLAFVKGVPDLPADPAIVSVIPGSAIPRAGRPLPIEIAVRNLGTRPVEDIRFAFEGLPEGVRCADPAQLAPTGTVAANVGYDIIGNDYMEKGLPHERRFRVTLTDPGRAMAFKAKLVMTAKGGVRREREVAFEVKPSLGLARLDYPPEPRPADTGGIEIGSFVFPGWDTHRWYPVWACVPERKPVLGWYDDRLPEVRDWQIKYLVENGISYVIVDWYWHKGRQSHNYWPKSFAKARYRKYLKWALMWCNEGRNMYDDGDTVKMTKFWVENYFGDPQYLTIDGKPVVVLWSSNAIDRDLGPGAAAKFMALSRKVATDAGYKGIYFVSQFGDMEDEKTYAAFKEQTLDATCAYRYTTRWSPHWPGLVDGNIPFSAVAETSLKHWRTQAKISPLPFWPSLSTGWGNFPWLGDRGWGISGKTPELFARICRDAKRFADETGCRRFLTGPLDEWSEGEIGWPNAEHGFGMLNAVRDAFAKKPPEGWPVNCAPEDVGLGPYLKPEVKIEGD